MAEMGSPAVMAHSAVGFGHRILKNAKHLPCINPISYQNRRDGLVAHVTMIQTGRRAITHVAGRVHCDQVGQRRQQNGARKPEQGLRARMLHAARQRLRVCLLSARDARWMEDYGIVQPCVGPGCHHSHHTRVQIEALVQSGSLRWVGGAENVAMWAEARTWKGVPSGGPTGPKVMQMVAGG